MHYFYKRFYLYSVLYYGKGSKTMATGSCSSGLTFLILTERTDPAAAYTLDLTEPFLPERADLSRKLDLRDLRSVVGAVTVRHCSGQDGAVERHVWRRTSGAGPVS
jgi:hypothetical protein